MFRFHIEEIDLNAESAHTKLLKLLGSEKKVLEVGCSTGYLSKVLKEQLKCSVTGIEIDEGAAKMAAKHCDRIIAGNVEELDFQTMFGNEKFDVAIFGDVLEHLKDPEKVLKTIRSFLLDTGFVLASIPNIAHISVALELLEGKFEYRSSGILDDTHIKFFTKKSISSLFGNSEYDIVLWDRVIKKPEETEFQTVLEKYPRSLLSFFEGESEAQTYQFIVKAIPSKIGINATLEKEVELTVTEELRRRIAEQDIIIRKFKRETGIREALMDSMINSWSWKITGPLRWLYGKMVGRKSKKRSLQIEKK
jgi:2-polyprenyl-3-methyl-5-hydroxy-6-metoxy-1,4-benzoquinol methylase